MNASTVAIEVCVDTVESALAAQTAGARRVELCDDLVEGGTTPSAGMIVVARRQLKIGLHVMIRPRGGDFCYSDSELEVMRQDIETARRLGADGVVFGVLRTDGSVDAVRTRELVEASRPLRVTFHRAFDMTCDATEALEKLIALGVDRVLTSGQEATASLGLPLISQLVRQAGDRILVMPGGGITEEDVLEVAKCGAREIHIGAACRVAGPMKFHNERVFMGSAYIPAEYARSVADSARIAGIVKKLSHP